MKKIIFTLLLVSTQINAVFFITPTIPEMRADSFVLMDYDSNKIIASKNLHKKRAPASLTKLMTSYVVFKRIEEGFIKFSDEVTISKNAWKTGGSRSFLKVGSKIKLETLIKGMIIQSGNDASVALAEHIAGTEMTFVTLMNQYARTLGMRNTNFESASGLPKKGQFTTSYDIALLSSAIIREFPKYYKWYGQKYFTHNNIKQPNRNNLLWSDKTVDGLKTGHTEKAGYCLAASSQRLGMRLISVVLGSSSTNARVAQTRQILDYGFRFFETKQITYKNSLIKVYKGNKNVLKTEISTRSYITLERGKLKKTTKQVKIKNGIIAPIKKGDKVGSLNILFNNETIKSLDIIASEDIEESGFFGKIIDTIRLWFS